MDIDHEKGKPSITEDFEHANCEAGYQNCLHLQPLKSGAIVTGQLHPRPLFSR